MKKVVQIILLCSIVVMLLILGGVVALFLIKGKPALECAPEHEALETCETTHAETSGELAVVRSELFALQETSDALKLQEEKMQDKLDTCLKRKEDLLMGGAIQCPSYAAGTKIFMIGIWKNGEYRYATVPGVNIAMNFSATSNVPFLLESDGQGYYFIKDTLTGYTMYLQSGGKLVGNNPSQDNFHRRRSFRIYPRANGSGFRIRSLAQNLGYQPWIYYTENKEIMATTSTPTEFDEKFYWYNWNVDQIPCL